MRELCHSVTDIDRQLEDAARAKQQLDAERWREQVRPRAMRLFAARTAKLHGSRALLKLLVEELYPDDLFDAAEQYGKEIGYPIRFDQESVKCMAVTVLIGMQGCRN